MEALAVITTPRAGAGHLFRLLENFDALAARPALFVPRAGTANPGVTLDAAAAEAQRAGRRVLAFTLTRGQLPLDIVERDVLSRPGMRVIMVMRRPIACYVSLRKANELGKWQDADTTKIRIRLDADLFEAWLDAEAGWYAHWQQWLTRRALPIPILHYETHLDQPPEAVLRRFAIAAAQLGVTLKPPATLGAAGALRQDHSTVMADKVYNWAEFSREIFRRGLERRAFSYPL